MAVNRRDPGPRSGSPAPGGPSKPGARPAANPAGPVNPARARAAPPPPPISWERRFSQLEASVEQFRVDSERFWNGGLPIPPEDLRTKIQRELRELRNGVVRSSIDQFRLGSIEARFNSLSELYGRRLREKEEGRGPAPARVAVATEARHDARAGIVFDGEPRADAVEALWTGLVASGGGARIELETFRGYLSRQLGEIRARTGVSAVQFRVVQEEGKLKLKAKPLTGDGE